MSFAGVFEAIPEGDFSAQWLKTIFGPALGSGEASVIADAAMTFNAALMLVAGGAIAWWTLAGLIATAHEGKVLGQKWHQIWAPIRVALGICMLAPLPGFGGFGAGQVVVLTISQWGMSLADAMWSGAATHVAAGGAVGSTSIPTSNELFHQLLRVESCRATAWAIQDDDVRKLWSLKDKRAGVSTFIPQEPIAGTKDVRGILSGKLEAKTHTWDYGVCGGVEIEVAVNTAKAVNGETLVTVADKSKVQAAQVDAIKTALPAVRSVAEALATARIAGGDYPTSSALDDARHAYDTAMQEAAKAAASVAEKAARTAYAKRAAEGGWTAAGSWYMSLATLSGQYIQAASIQPDIKAPRIPAYGLGIPQINEGIADAEHWYQSRVAFKGANNEKLAKGGEESVFDKLDFFDMTRLKSVFDMAELDTSNPIGSMVSLGHNVLIVTEAATLAGAMAWVAGGSILGDVVGADGGLTFLMPLAWGILFGLYACGIMYAYVLPMMPYILHSLAVLGWLIFVCEAVIAAPIWALAHVRFDGAEMIDSAQRGGYVLAFNLFLRPALITLGLLLSLTVFGAFAEFVNATFYPAMLGATSGHFAGLIGMVCMLALLSYLHWQIAAKCFSLITVVPDRVARWFGAGAESLGEAEETSKHTNIVGAVVGKIESGKPYRGGGKGEKGGDDSGGNGTSASAPTPALNVPRGGGDQ